MGLPECYLMTTKNLDALLNSLQSAQAPEKFTLKFLEQLDFTSSNDRLHIKMFKDLGFLDETGVPTERYHKFLDASEARRVMSEALREAYSDLFTIRKDAWKMTEEEVAGKLKTLTQGKKSENVIKLMAKTFKALCEYADWSKDAVSEETLEIPAGTEKPTNKNASLEDQQDKMSLKGGLHYNIQLHLPESRDPKVYDAIFESIRKHLI
jgi:hypothetical protein